MERMIASLVGRYESGSLTRRELIQSLGALTMGQVRPTADILTVESINHVSVQVSDVRRSIAFYTRVLGLTEARSDADTARLVAGRCHVSVGRGNPVGVIDHFAFGITRFDKDALTMELRGRGAEAREDAQFGFHVQDPDGVRVQIIENDTAHR